jgi:hypothetical protein
VLTVAVAYSAYGDGLVETAISLVQQTVPLSWESLLQARTILGLIFWIMGLLGLVLLAAELRLKEAMRARWAIVIAAIGLIVATIANRHPFAHYLIQIMPCFAIGAAYVFWRVGWGSGWRIAPAFVVVLALAAVGMQQPYQVVVDRYRDGKSLYVGQTFSIVQFLNQRFKEGDTLFVTHNILLYWLLDREPPLPIAAFPENIFRERQIVKPLMGEDYTTEKVLNDILDRRPTFIVMRGDADYLGIPSFARRIESDYEIAGRQRETYVLKLIDRTNQ